jgi:dihydrodipicolinate synthase/N-acetylneuraminate lyase
MMMNKLLTFFEEICNHSNYPILVHGNILRKGFGGNYEYSRPLLESLKNIDGFIGMKEESSTLMHSIKNIPEGLEVIVAGGSMRRFWSLEPHGATTFLSGVGSFNPTIDEYFYNEYYNNPKNAKETMVQFETTTFNTFMSIGWHLSMRTALKEMGFIIDDRKPFKQVSEEQKSLIKTKLQNLL